MAFKRGLLNGAGTLVRTLIQSENFSTVANTGWRILKSGQMICNELIVRGAIVADAIFSSNYDAGDGEIEGWFLGEDGEAAFSDVTIGNEGYTIDSGGKASFEQVNVNSSLRVAGVDFAEAIDSNGIGVVWLGRLDGGNSEETDSPRVQWADFVVPNIQARIYKLTITNLYLVKGANNPTSVAFYGYNDFDDAAGTSDNLFLWQTVYFSNTVNDEIIGSIQGIFIVGSSDAGSDLYISLWFESVSGMVIAPAPFGVRNQWVILEDLGPSADLVVTDVDITATTGGTPPSIYTDTYTATATKAFKGDGSLYTADIDALQGQSTFSGNGNMASAFGFDYSTIQSDLSGATILKTEIFLYYHHWYYFTGGTAIIGTHNDTNVAGATQESDISGVTEAVATVSGWARNEGRWVDVGTDVGEDLRDGNVKGVWIGDGPTTSFEYYGRADSHSQTNPPKIRVTYEV